LKKQTDYVSKEQIGEFLGLSNERSVRDVISLLATKKPIISHSGSKGYKLAQTEKDMEEVERTWAELSSRMQEIEKRTAPLIAFREKFWGK
jgi:biotin operon repressor